MCLALGCGHVGTFHVQPHFILTELSRHVGAVVFLMIQMRELRFEESGSLPVSPTWSQGSGMGPAVTLAPEPCANNPLGHSSAGCLSRTCGAGPGNGKDPLFKSFFFFSFSYTRLASSVSQFTTTQSPFLPAY